MVLKYGIIMFEDGLTIEGMFKVSITRKEAKKQILGLLADCDAPIKYYKIENRLRDINIYLRQSILDELKKKGLF